VATLGANLESLVQVITHGELSALAVSSECDTVGGHSDTGADISRAIKRQKLSANEVEAHEVIDFAFDQCLHVGVATVGDLIDVHEEIIELNLRNQKEQSATEHLAVVLACGFVNTQDRLGLDNLGQGQAGVGSGSSVDVVDCHLLGRRKINGFVAILADVCGASGGIDYGLVVGALEGHCVRLDYSTTRRADFAEKLFVPFVLVVDFVIGAERELALCEGCVGRDGFARACGDKTSSALADEIQQFAFALNGFLANQGVNPTFALLHKVLPVLIELVGIVLGDSSIRHWSELVRINVFTLGKKNSPRAFNTLGPGQFAVIYYKVGLLG